MCLVPCLAARERCACPWASTGLYVALPRKLFTWPILDVNTRSDWEWNCYTEMGYAEGLSSLAAPTQSLSWDDSAHVSIAISTVTILGKRTVNPMAQTPRSIAVCTRRQTFSFSPPPPPPGSLTVVVGNALCPSRARLRCSCLVFFVSVDTAVDVVVAGDSDVPGDRVGASVEQHVRGDVRHPSGAAAARQGPLRAAQGKLGYRFGSKLSLVDVVVSIFTQVWMCFFSSSVGRVSFDSTKYTRP